MTFRREKFVERGTKLKDLLLALRVEELESKNLHVHIHLVATKEIKG